MTPSLVDAESVLSIDFGSVQTRALLFDVVEGQYNFIAAGLAPCTMGAPYFDALESFHIALDHLRKITGRTLLDDEELLILPGREDGTGVDRLVITFSAGEELKLVVTGLLGDVSLESVQRAASSAYARVVDSISLSDRRRSDVQLDALLKARPDLILMAGGTDGGASKTIFRLADLLALTCRLLAREDRPEIIYAGNQTIATKIKEGLSKWTTVHVAPNLRPTIDLEDPGPAQNILSQVVAQIRSRRTHGLEGLSAIASAPTMPTAAAFGRMLRFLGQVYDTSKGVLGADVGASWTTIAAASGKTYALNVTPVGSGAGAAEILRQCSLAEITRWLPVHIQPEEVRDRIFQKSLHPNTLPETQEDLWIEHAVARQAMRLGMAQTFARWPNLGYSFEPMLVSGAVVTHAPTPQQSLMMVLDGLQPIGMSTIILDQNGITPALGAIAAFNSILPVQVFESGAYLPLATVICPVSSAREGTPILQARLEYQNGEEDVFEVVKGSLLALPLRFGVTGNLYLKPLRGTTLDSRLRPAGGFKITGGMCGAIIDARGRPLNLPAEDARRRELLKKWAMALGG
jgi:hypothetical protein